MNADGRGFVGGLPHPSRVSRSCLLEAVAHYCTGVKPSPTLDPNLTKHPDGGLRLGADDQAALVAFLNTLTDVAILTSRQPATLEAGSP